MTKRQPSRGQRGAALVEALVAMLIIAFGVLGFIGMQARSSVGGVEGYQRAQALELLQDMAQRMNLNRVGTRQGSYQRADVGVDAACLVPLAPQPAPPGFDTTAFNLANSDVCAWHALIRDTLGQPGAALAGVRGCITATANAGEYLVALVWRGVHATAPSPLACGKGDTTAFPDDNLRRGVSTVVRIGSLQ